MAAAQPELRALYAHTLQREGYDVASAGNLADAWQLLDTSPFDVALVDMQLPDGSGLALVQRWRARQPARRCVAITTTHGEDAAKALAAGACGCLARPVDLKELRTAIALAVQALETAAALAAADDAPSALPLLRSLETIPAPLAIGEAGAAALARLVGDSAPMRLVKSRIARVARGMAPVLVRGESGTGKELVARAVHACSPRQGRPFIAVNCAAIPDSLLEAEFFGALKGSYTGALQDRDGYFQAARGGTLFLDEIGDLPLAMQAKLLRAIQERSVRQIGATQEEVVDVRIVSATHKDLQAEVEAGRFRQDLFYRLDVIEIAVPALRERREDLPALCATLLAQIAGEAGLPAPTLSPEVVRRLAAHPLKGNVRELENLLHRAVALGDGDVLHIDRLPGMPYLPRLPESANEAGPLPDETWPIGFVRDATTAAAVSAPIAPPPLPTDLQAHLDQQERDILVRALRASGFNRTSAAARLGLSLRQIRYRIARLGIATPHDEDNASERRDA